MLSLYTLLILLYTVCNGDLGGGDRDRTCDLLLAKQPLSQLSYTPICYTYLLWTVIALLPFVEFTLPGTLITKTAKSMIRRPPHPVKVNLRLDLSEPALPYIALDDIMQVNTAFFRICITNGRA